MNKKIFTPKQWIIFDYQLGAAIGFADFQGGIPVRSIIDAFGYVFVI